MPDISEYQLNWSWIDRTNEVPVSLVRNDGIIYATGLTFNYNVELGLRCRTIPNPAVLPVPLPVQPQPNETSWVIQNQQQHQLVHQQHQQQHLHHQQLPQQLHFST